MITKDSDKKYKLLPMALEIKAINGIKSIQIPWKIINLLRVIIIVIKLIFTLKVAQRKNMGN